MIYFFWEYNFSSISVLWQFFTPKTYTKLRQKPLTPTSTTFLSVLLLINSTNTHHPIENIVHKTTIEQKDINQLEGIINGYKESYMITVWVNTYSSD